MTIKCIRTKTRLTTKTDASLTDRPTLRARLNVLPRQDRRSYCAAASFHDNHCPRLTRTSLLTNILVEQRYHINHKSNRFEQSYSKRPQSRIREHHKLASPARPKTSGGAHLVAILAILTSNVASVSNPVNNSQSIHNDLSATPFCRSSPPTP